MKEFEFTLKFILGKSGVDPEVFIEALGAAGCDDAIIGIGKYGRLALHFCRESESAKAAILSAISEVKNAIPGARLIEASPDRIGITEAGTILGCSRQNFRKLMISHHGTFPVPNHEEQHLALYHLADVLNWFQDEQTSYKVSPILQEVADANKEVNILNSIGVFNAPETIISDHLHGEQMSKIVNISAAGMLKSKLPAVPADFDPASLLTKS